jgi:hypothetical protein
MWLTVYGCDRRRRLARLVQVVQLGFTGDIASQGCAAVLGRRARGLQLRGRFREPTSLARRRRSPARSTTAAAVPCAASRTIARTASRATSAALVSPAANAREAPSVRARTRSARWSAESTSTTGRSGVVSGA